jgi:hypothetical protein
MPDNMCISAEESRETSSRAICTASQNIQSSHTLPPGQRAAIGEQSRHVSGIQRSPVARVLCGQQHTASFIGVRQAAHQPCSYLAATARESPHWQCQTGVYGRDETDSARGPAGGTEHLTSFCPQAQLASWSDLPGSALSCPATCIAVHTRSRKRA